MAVHVLGEVAIGGLEQFLSIFASEGQDKRREHGCVRAEVFTREGEDGVVLVLMEFTDRQSFDEFREDPDAPPIMRKGGAQGPPVFTILDRAASFEH